MSEANRLFTSFIFHVRPKSRHRIYDFRNAPHLRLFFHSLTCPGCPGLKFWPRTVNLTKTLKNHQFTPANPQKFMKIHDFIQIVTVSQGVTGLYKSIYETSFLVQLFPVSITKKYRNIKMDFAHPVTLWPCDTIQESKNKTKQRDTI